MRVDVWIEMFAFYRDKNASVLAHFRAIIRCIAKMRAAPNNVKPTHLCCDIVKQIVVWSQSGSDRKGGHDVSRC
jgi:hypothetical protein